MIRLTNCQISRNRLDQWRTCRHDRDGEDLDNQGQARDVGEVEHHPPDD
ncbi:hypothetical protein [Mycobacterium lepromatosis]|nr:hypothetical protein [Mycobacterium lepromatosis]